MPPGVRPVGWPSTPLVRCLAIPELLDERCVAIEDTAAWVWGVRRTLGKRTVVSTRDGRMSGLLPTGALCRQFTFAGGDLVKLGSHWVTTPDRTAFDLLRSSDHFSRTRRVAVRLLIQIGEGGVDALKGRVEYANNSTRHRVLTRLEGLYGTSSSADIRRRPRQCVERR